MDFKTVAGSRKLTLTVFSYTNFIYIAFISIVVITCGNVKIKFGVKNILISIAILAADIAVTPFFKELIHVTTPIADINSYFSIMFISTMTVFAWIAACGAAVGIFFTISEKISRSVDDDKDKMITTPLGVVGAYCASWYLGYSLLNATLILIEVLAMIFINIYIYANIFCTYAYDTIAAIELPGAAAYVYELIAAKFRADWTFQ